LGRRGIGILDVTAALAVGGLALGTAALFWRR
jgi:hypothetical protein